MRAIAPNGATIVGTYEIVSGIAWIVGDSFRSTTEGLDFVYSGDTKIDWDGQQTTTAASETGPQRVFVDENYESWLETEIKLVED